MARLLKVGELLPVEVLPLDEVSGFTTEEICKMLKHITLQCIYTDKEVLVCDKFGKQKEFTAVNDLASDWHTDNFDFYNPIIGDCLLCNHSEIHGLDIYYY